MTDLDAMADKLRPNITLLDRFAIVFYAIFWPAELMAQCALSGRRLMEKNNAG